MSRQPMAFEVELVVITGEADQAGLGRWATLAAAGYRVSQVTLGSGKQWIYLERPVIGDSSNVRLPAIVEQDVPTAEALRAKIHQAANERAQVLRAQFPVGGSAVPVPAPKPAPKSAEANK